MLEIQVPDGEYYDEVHNEFVTVPGGKLVMEHSLIALSKWEAKWHKPFLSQGKKSEAELLDYVRCMTIGKVDNRLYFMLSAENMNSINEYIADSMTATTFNEQYKEGQTKRKASRPVTSEELYYDMIALGIPFECQKWHINRLQTLIKICSIKSQPPKKLKGKALAKHNTQLNAARRAKHHTKG